MAIEDLDVEPASVLLFSRANLIHPFARVHALFSIGFDWPMPVLGSVVANDLLHL